MRRVLSALVMAMVLTGAYIGAAHATGANALPELSAGVDQVGQTIQSTEVMGTIGWIAIACLSVIVLSAHAGGGFFGMFVGLIAIGLWFNGQRIAETLGWTAVMF